jgi:hypothetical protein
MSSRRPKAEDADVFAAIVRVCARILTRRYGRT